MINLQIFAKVLFKHRVRRQKFNTQYFFSKDKNQNKKPANTFLRWQDAAVGVAVTAKSEGEIASKN